MTVRVLYLSRISSYLHGISAHCHHGLSSGEGAQNPSVHAFMGKHQMEGSVTNKRSTARKTMRLVLSSDMA